MSAMAAPTTEPDVNKMFARSDREGLLRLASHAALLGASSGLLYFTAGTIAVLVAVPIHGVLLAFLFCPLHETIHRTVFASRAPNDWLAGVCGLVLVLPARYFRAFHLAHHRHTQDAQLDPELGAPKPASLPRYWWYLSGIPYWVDRIHTLAQHASGRVTDVFIAQDKRPAVVREARVHLAVYGLIAGVSWWTQSTVVLAYWLLPILVGQPALRLFLLAEHSGCPAVADMLKNSRTTLTNPLVRLIAWNMPYHTAHHRYPAVPFFNLPALHRKLSDRIAVVAPSYTTFHREFVRNLRRHEAEPAT